MILGVGAIAAMLGMMSFSINRLVRRKLRLSIVLLAAYLAADVALALYGGRLSADAPPQIRAFARLALAAALINAVVALVINPLREDRVPERFPAILQDAMVIALILLASTFLSQQLLTTSAVSAVVLGFALQDTLGNAFAGLAIQSEKPFHVGHWVKAGDHEGRVAEVTWRATKLRTKTGNFVVVPNNVLSKEAITNYSEPASPTMIDVVVGASYEAPPNQVKAAALEALRHCSRVLTAPAPDVLLFAFDGSAISYKARFWIDDYENDDLARDEVRTAIYYAFQRHAIEIPWPIQVQYERPWREADPARQVDRAEQLLGGVDLFATLTADLRREVATAAPTLVYGSGESIVREGDAGHSMFVVMTGTVSVVVGPARNEVARIEQGGYFGEMSLLTGEGRSASVVAVGDVEVIEIAAGLFRRLARAHPEAIEKIGVAAMMRREGLDRVRSATADTVTAEAAGLMTRMKKFLRLA